MIVSSVLLRINMSSQLVVCLYKGCYFKYGLQIKMLNKELLSLNVTGCIPIFRDTPLTFLFDTCDMFLPLPKPFN